MLLKYESIIQKRRLQKNEKIQVLVLVLPLIGAPLVAQTVKNPPQMVKNAGDLGLIPGLRRFPGEGNSYPLQNAGLENSMDCIIHEVVESDMTKQLSLHCH